MDCDKCDPWEFVQSKLCLFEMNIGVGVGVTTF